MFVDVKYKYMRKKNTTIPVSGSTKHHAVTSTVATELVFVVVVSQNTRFLCDKTEQCFVDVVVVRWTDVNARSVRVAAETPA